MDLGSKARKEMRQAIVRGAEIVACTLSSAGGDLLTLSKGGPGFQALIVDEVASSPFFTQSTYSTHAF